MEPARMRIGNGFDVHPFSARAASVLRIAGVEVGSSPGLEGHSDADVVAHAVADALLGATATGDLGSRFGVDRDDTRDADSLDLLAEVAVEVAAAGWELGNLDVTVLAERPRLAPYREPMRRALADALDAPVGAVSVKFTTTDRLGAIGRVEGIAAWATCLLVAGQR